MVLSPLDLLRAGNERRSAAVALPVIVISDLSAFPRSSDHHNLASFLQYISVRHARTEGGTLVQPLKACRVRSGSWRDSVQVEVVRDLERLGDYAGKWNDLVLSSPQQLPTVSHAWISSYLEHRLQPDDDWCCLAAHRDGELLGILPVVCSPVPVLGLRACKLHTPHDDHTFGCDAVLSESATGDVLRLLYEKLMEVFPSLRVVEFKRLPDFSPTYSMSSCRPDHTFILEEFCAFGNFFRIEGSYEDYKSHMPTRFTRNLRRLGRKVRSLPDLQFTRHTGAGQGDEYLQTFLDIEASGWKKRSGSAISLDPGLVEFYRTLTRRLSDTGWLEWNFLRTGDRAIAGHLGIRMNRSYVLFKIAYDESFSSYSPGNVLLDMMLEREFTAGELDEINCVSDSGWMRNWYMDRRSYHNIYLFPMNLLPIFFSYVPARVKSAGKRIHMLRSAYDACCHIGDYLTRKDRTANG